MNKYKKFLITVNISILFYLGLIALFNYKVDSAGIFHSTNVMQQAAKEIINGKIVAGLGDEAFDDRAFQISLIKLLKHRVTIIATGSSRTKELRKNYLQNGKYSFYNHAVNGANLEDYIAILGAYKKFHNYFPKEVILGVDPWILNRNNGRIRWKNIQNYHMYANQILTQSDNSSYDKISFFQKYKELVNYNYTIANIDHILTKIKRGKPYYIVKDLNVNDFLREPDASIHYPYETRFPNLKEVHLKALQYTKGSVYGLENFDYSNKKEKLQQLIQALQNDGVNITLFLAPYHPITYDILSKIPKYHIKEIENYFHEFAEKNQLKIVGSYNPYKLNLSEKDFFDGMHCNDQAIKQIFNSWNPSSSSL